jgi:ABC-type multidrug transport system fused ATPase/permease subunit
MRLGLYLIAAIILMAIVGIFVYTINPNNYSISQFGLSVTMPIAVWIILPMLALMFASVVHMMFYSTKNFFKFKKWEKDTVSLDDALYWSLLNEPKAHKFNLPILKQTASLLDVSCVKVDGAVDDISDKLRGALTLVTEIDRGEYVDLKARKLDKVLSKENPLVVKNLMNRLTKETTFAEEVLQSKELYSDELFDEALKNFSLKTTFPKAKKYANIYNKESFFMLLERVAKEDNLDLTKDILDAFIVALESKLICSDYLSIATLMMTELSPDENLKLWREYEGKYTDAQIAYLYLLFDYEMIEKAGEYLEEHEEKDFKRFRALYDLKKEHKKYKITDLMNIRHICQA